ncbi:TraV family lipoprotein [Sphingomonas sp. H39-1-10]|uniref:TraV family lipoprotein n=1 Tax=Sphingomonas pollutisoli TaxID=3030829 RepID=UPI0023B8A854|nr:TraV family lipoprotein [Sphingomonas pollutisoli]MDF0490567.1 TraV family lipoprotein [Sphingomonas pollutisoli]
MSRRLDRSRRAPIVLGSAGLAALTVLSGCATFGSNVRGSFSCAAPDGICAPSSSIDDRALAMIAGQSGGDAVPAGPYMETRPKARASRTAATRQIVPVELGDARRTQERVLRIVFQPYIDERGRLHEMSAVHAVVQSGEWQQQSLASATLIPDRNVSSMRTMPESLAEAVDRADPAIVDVAAIDPDLPDPAVVAAARARSADPLAAIKSDVAARLAPKAGRNAPASVPSAERGRAQPTNAPTPAPKSVGQTGNPGAASATSKTTSASPASVTALPAAKPDAKPVVRAAGFPASVPQDN